MSEITIKLSGVDELKQSIKEFKRKAVLDIRDVLNKNALKLVTHIRTDLIKFVPGLFTGGTSDNTLASRSGQLKRSIGVIPASVSKESVSSGIKFGTHYAGVHIGPKGKTTTMKKNSKYLTIPLPAAQGPHGQAKGRARDESLWGETIALRSAKGNLIIFGKTKGARTGQTKGDLVPLFLLVKSVTVKTRIHPEDLIAWVEPKIVSDLKEASNTWHA